MNLAFNKWNVWYMKRDSALHRKSPIEEWPIAPRLFEEAYSVLDAVVLRAVLRVPAQACGSDSDRQPGSTRECHRSD